MFCFTVTQKILLKQIKIWHSKESVCRCSTKNDSASTHRGTRRERQVQPHSKGPDEFLLQRVTKVFKRMVRLARLDDRLRFHDTRHTCGSWLAMNGVPLRVIQALLGHQSITTTEMYSHLMPEMISAAIDATFGNE